MGGVCLCDSRTCRPVWPVLMILAAAPCVVHCSESPAAAAGKMYPRGNHWAVGHLMGKKSIESLEEVQETNPDSDYLTPPEAAGVTELDRYERLMEALVQQKNLKQTKPQTADRLLRLRSGWREEDRDKYLREMSDLLLLALKLQGNDST
ncbi:gastrin-releasing peptide isoform X1 [Trachinotus anak]|uniref:gastrin-releasing peptide isoform X1 n=1 Tax=Trachinotus anak TaxID=443729 RepID=UPI0039F1B016